MIGYQAMLTWGKLTLGYHGSINFYNPSEITDEDQFATQSFQETKIQSKIEFKTDQLKGTWFAIDAPYSHFSPTMVLVAYITGLLRIWNEYGFSNVNRALFPINWIALNITL